MLKYISLDNVEPLRKCHETFSVLFAQFLITPNQPFSVHLRSKNRFVDVRSDHVSYQMSETTSQLASEGASEYLCGLNKRLIFRPFFNAAPAITRTPSYVAPMAEKYSEGNVRMR